MTLGFMNYDKLDNLYKNANFFKENSDQEEQM